MSTTITGKIENLGQAAIAIGTFVRFYLRGAGGNQPRVDGTAIIAPTVGNVYYFDFVPNASGVISGTLWSTRDSTGLLGGDIEVGGVTTAVWYGIVVFQNGKAGPETPVHAKNTVTLDISNVTPITTNPVVTAPTGDSTYARLDGGNMPFTGTIQGVNETLTGSFAAQSNIDRLCVGAAPCYTTVAAAVTAAGSTNKTIIEIRSSYAGVDCGAAQDNLIYFDYRGMNPPCNANNSIHFNSATSTVPHMLLEPILNVTNLATGLAMTTAQFSSFISGTLPGAAGISDGIAATGFTTGSLTGTLGTLRGAELAAAVSSLLGTVTIAEGVVGYVAGNPVSTTAIGTVRGVTGIGCAQQTYGTQPTNCYGGYFWTQGTKGATRNYSAGFEGPVVLRFDATASKSLIDAEDSGGVAHNFVYVDSGNLAVLQAVNAAGVDIRDNGATARIKIVGSDVRLPTQHTIANANVAGSPIALAAVTSQKAETQAADANVLTFTPPAVAGQYEVCVVISVSAATSGVIAWTLSWTDSNGAGQSNIAQQIFQMGTAAPNTTFTTSAAGNYYGSVIIDVNAGANNIVVKWVGGGTTTAKMSATIRRII